MLWCVLVHLLGFVVDLLIPTRRTDRDKELQTLGLQHQRRLLQRERPQPRHLTRWEKLTVAVLTAKLASRTTGPRARLDQVRLLFKPATVLKWHREVVRRQWTVRRPHPGGRPATPAEVEDLVLRVAREHATWGYSRIPGELLKLGCRRGRSTVRAVLQRHRVPPAPSRPRQSSTWRAFLSRHRDQIVACDFFTVETLVLTTVSGLGVIAVGPLRMHLAGCTTHPTAAWVTHLARPRSWQIQDGALPARSLLHDRDSKFVPAFDPVFQSEGVTIVRTRYRAPNAKDLLAYCTSVA